MCIRDSLDVEAPQHLGALQRDVARAGRRDAAARDDFEQPLLVAATALHRLRALGAKLSHGNTNQSHVAFASPEHVEVLARLEDLRHDVEAVTAKIDDAGRKARSAASPSHARRAHSPRKESKEAPAPAPAPADDNGWLSPTALACGDIMGEDV